MARRPISTRTVSQNTCKAIPCSAVPPERLSQTLEGKCLHDSQRAEDSLTARTGSGKKGSRINSPEKKSVTAVTVVIFNPRW